MPSWETAAAPLCRSRPGTPSCGGLGNTSRLGWEPDAAGSLQIVVKEHFVKREAVIRLAILMCLVAAGAMSRIYFRELPNFAPIAAMALFAGYFFRTARVAVLVPLLAMSLSDLVIGGYQWQMMVIVYGSLTLPVALGPLLRKYLAIEPGS